MVAVAAALLALHLASVVLCLWRLRPTPLPRAAGQPHVTLLRPVCGLDPFDAETLASSFTQDYPAYDVVFCAARETDAAVPLVRALITTHPGFPARLLIGEAPVTGNPKLNNLWKGWVGTESDWICMADSNLLLPSDYLATVVGTWDADVGLVSSPPVGQQPQGWGGHLECAMLNSCQARLQLASDSLGMGFAQGKTMLVYRPILDRAGGFTALGRLMAEDATATHLIRGLGLRVALTQRPFAQPIGWRGLRQVWDRQLRWSRVRREGFPLLFAAEILNGPLAPALLALAGGITPGMIAGAWALWYLAELALIRAAGWPSSWRDIAALPLRDAVLLALWVATFARRGFEWRGTRMTAGDGVRSNARTANATPAQPRSARPPAPARLPPRSSPPRTPAHSWPASRSANTTPPR